MLAFKDHNFEGEGEEGQYYLLSILFPHKPAVLNFYR